LKRFTVGSEEIKGVVPEKRSVGAITILLACEMNFWVEHMHMVMERNTSLR
jgi:hypothetical protein